MWTSQQEYLEKEVRLTLRFLRGDACLNYADFLQALLQRLGARPVWLSTAGGGVDWLHVRLDDRPKYYRHREWRQRPR